MGAKPAASADGRGRRMKLGPPWALLNEPSRPRKPGRSVHSVRRQYGGARYEAHRVGRALTGVPASYVRMTVRPRT